MTASPPNTSMRRPRILVVDDNEVNCELFEAMLLPEGYTVVQAHSGTDALHQATHERPDMVLLDVNMPGMDGFEVVRRLRKQKVTRTLPVVMVTALGDLDHRVRGLESGADDYLTKPVSQAELLARVQSSLRVSWLRQQVDERQKLELVLGDVSDGIVIVDASGRVCDVSPSAQRFLAIDDSTASIAGVWGSFLDVPADLLNSVVAGDARDFTVRGEDSPLFLRVNLRPVHGPDGNPTGAVLSLRDVTADALENKLQQDVLSLVSHKFRTPLTVVHSWTRVLLDDGCGPLADEQRQALQAIDASSEEIRGILDGILTYVEWTQRLHRMRKQSVSFEVLTRELRQRAQGELGADAGLTLEHDDGEVVVDVAIFLDAILELIRNAGKFGSDDTTVHVSMRRLNSAASIEVRDNGPGIPREHLERIFQRFYQVEADFTGQVHGLGLGLANVKRAMQAMGASLHVESKLEQGTCFTINF